MQTKLENKPFVKFIISTYDFVFLSECWFDKEFTFELPGCKCHLFPRLKSKPIQGGGMIILIRDVR